MSSAQQKPKYQVIIYGFDTEEEAETARRECQLKYCKWAAAVRE